MGRRPGAPTKYRPEYAQRLIDFFNIDSTKESVKTFTTKQGTVIEEPVELANKMPFFITFADELGVDEETLLEWTKQRYRDDDKEFPGQLKHPEFNVAYSRAKKYQERHLVDNALLGNFNPGFAALVAKNWLGWKDKTETDITSKGEQISFVADVPRPKD